MRSHIASALRWRAKVGMMSGITGKSGKLGAALALIASLLAFSSAAQATPVTFTASGTSSSGQPVSASVTFSVSGSNLIVVLTNTSTKDTAYQNPDLLEGVFFSIKGTPLTLTPVSASLTSGSSFVGTATHSLGSEWDYRFSSTGFSNGSFSTTDKYGIGAAGFSGIYSKGNFASPGQNVGGLDYGLVGNDWNAATATTGTKNQEPFVKNSITFVFSGVPAGFNPLTSIFGIIFAYGTAPDFTIAAPEPASLGFFGIGLLAFFAFAWTRKKVASRALKQI